jgi:hypothetical protein
MKVKQVAVAAALLMGVASFSGCALFLVGAAVGAGAGTISYMGNELRTTQEINIDRAWTAGMSALEELQFHIDQGKSYKDATGATLFANNAKNQPVRIQLLRRAGRDV